MYYAYKYIKRKRAEKRAAKAAEAGGDPVATEAHPSNSELAPQNAEAETVKDSEPAGSWKWRLLLMLALAMPIFLETLDYTGVFLPPFSTISAQFI